VADTAWRRRTGEPRQSCSGASRHENSFLLEEKKIQNKNTQQETSHSIDAATTAWIESGPKILDYLK